MPLNISYMGTKRRLASAVAEVVSLAPTGPVLDLFSGMCAVGSAVAPSRQVWCNDIQRLAAEVATAFFTAKGGPSHSLPVLNRTICEFRRNARTLKARFGSELAAEAAALDSGNPDRIARTDAQAPNVAKSFRLTREREHLTRFTGMFPYRLFSITFSGGYFGLRQCIEIDSIRFAIDRLFRQKAIGQSEHRWMLLALCQAASKMANTTGHFAQYLKVKARNVDRFVRQRQRSAWSEWQDAIRSLHPLGSTSWRQRNCVFQFDALSLLGSLRSADTRPSVIYADPPYTAELC
jgi:adenine-specific DNA-methyltransferase